MFSLLNYSSIISWACRVHSPEVFRESFDCGKNIVTSTAHSSLATHVFLPSRENYFQFEFSKVLAPVCTPWLFADADNRGFGALRRGPMWTTYCVFWKITERASNYGNRRAANFKEQHIGKRYDLSRRRMCLSFKNVFYAFGKIIKEIFNITIFLALIVITILFLKC